MPVSRAMRRLLDVLEIQEEECRAALEAARAEFARLAEALARSRERERGGRRLVASSAATGELTDRVAGIEETRAAGRLAAVLLSRVAEAEAAVHARERSFLGKRIERRQTETLIEESQALDKVEAERREQRDLDEWFLSRRRTT
jgi:flagellar biosynthesis chaperone FliJ